MIKQIKERYKKHIEDLKFAQASFSNADMENNKYMIALGYYGAICKSLIKQGIEIVDDVDLISEHEQTVKVVNNLFNFMTKSVHNLSNPEVVKKQREDVYLKMLIILRYCLNNDITKLNLKYRDGSIFKRNHKIDIQEEINDINELLIECK